ncbi:heterokaryon incompatibility protein-domain-containing protein [Pholiota molesta]|nr:heterokaryon incompatibility protein-domain-containing protein [Pholiota molesta]
MAPPATESTGSDPGRLEDSELKPSDATLMGRIPGAVREHVFSTMPIRLLHFKIAGDSDTKLQITLLDRNGVYGQVIEEIQLNYSEGTLRERVDKELSMKRANNSYNIDERSIEDDIIKQIVRKATGYAILSHTWLRGSDSEITYGDWQIGQFDTQQSGYQKLANFCNSARKDHGLSFGWMDTICINKDSSSELDESIRSMYKWYENSAICIIYLAETLILDNIHRDCWFTRGWTLQELLAPWPGQLVFYNKDWKRFAKNTLAYNSKENEDIMHQIYEGTTMTHDEFFIRNNIPISRAMQLAARRTVTRQEDISYSLMGICKVSISIAYGEGAEQAFFRLIKEILNTTKDVFDVFNCAQKGGGGPPIIPWGPLAYLHRFENIRDFLGSSSPIEPLLLTHVGLRMPLLLMPSLIEDDPHCQNKSIGDYSATLQFPGSEDPLDARWNGCYRLLDTGIATCEKEVSSAQDRMWPNSQQRQHQLLIEIL